MPLPTMMPTTMASPSIRRNERLRSVTRRGICTQKQGGAGAPPTVIGVPGDYGRRRPPPPFEGALPRPPPEEARPPPPPQLRPPPEAPESRPREGAGRSTPPPPRRSGAGRSEPPLLSRRSGARASGAGASTGARAALRVGAGRSIHESRTRTGVVAAETGTARTRVLVLKSAPGGIRSRGPTPSVVGPSATRALNVNPVPRGRTRSMNRPPA